VPKEKKVTACCSSSLIKQMFLQHVTHTAGMTVIAADVCLRNILM